MSSILNNRRRSQPTAHVRNRTSPLRQKSSGVEWMKLIRRSYLKLRIHRKVVGGTILIMGLYCLIIQGLMFNRKQAGGNSLHLQLQHPIVLGCYFNQASHKIERIRHLPIHDEDRYPSKRQVDWLSRDVDFHKHLRDSKDYNSDRAEVIRDKRCKLPYEWQRRARSTCNSLHERDFTSFFIEASTTADERLRMVDGGFWRDVWKIRSDETNEWVASKTLAYEHEYSDRNFDRHKRDAIAMEHTTSSPYIADMFGFCGHSMLTEFAPEGSLSELIWPEVGNSTLSSRERLDLALDVARGIADLHFPDDSNGTASIVHSDITPSQFLMINGKIKLNDFNRCRFLTQRSNHKVCSFRVSNNPGKFRSPEEYLYKKENEKIDVFSMGNVFYSLLTELWPFEEMKEKDAQNKIKNGKRPPMPFLNDTDPAIEILSNAMKMSWTFEESHRASSKDIVKYLEDQTASLGS